MKQFTIIREGAQQTRCARTMLSVLEALPDGVLLDTNALAVRCERARATIHQHCAHPDLNPHRYYLGGGTQALWGNQKTIKEYKRERGM